MMMWKWTKPEAPLEPDFIWAEPLSEQQIHHRLKTKRRMADPELKGIFMKLRGTIRGLRGLQSLLSTLRVSSL